MFRDAGHVGLASQTAFRSYFAGYAASPSPANALSLIHHVLMVS